MVDTQTSIKPPYPTLGEVCQLLSSAFDTKSADAKTRKKLDRLARDGDFDWSLPRQSIEVLLLKPLLDFDRDLSDFIGNFVEFLFLKHVNLLSQVPLDALSREEAAPLLIKHVYAGHASSFLAALRDRFDGPDLSDFIRQEANPVDVVFRWAEETLGLHVAHLAYPDDKQKRDDVGRWRRGVTIPGFYSSILPLQRELNKKVSGPNPKVTLFGKWLVVARAYAWFDRECCEAGFGPLLPLIGREILLNCPPRDVRQELSVANYDAGKRLREVAKSGGLLVNGRLRRTEEKLPGDQAAARVELDKFEKLLNEHDTDGRARYMLDWCEGRWRMLSGEEEAALEPYERAADQALYRAGLNQRQILEEAISLAAHLGKRAAVKRLKHRALAMGLFSGLFSQFPESPDVVSDWEIEQLAQAFGHLFPVQGRFPEAGQSAPPSPLLPFNIIDRSVAETLKPDCKKPDRVIALPTLDDRRYRKPQLMWFAAQGQVDYVLQLLEAGANVNISDGKGGSALLNALQCAEEGRGRRVLDLLLEWPHEEETLNRLTMKKRLSPLYQAVLLGYPEVVLKLLKMGASPDLPAGYPPQTPLYLCVGRFGFYRQGFVKTQLLRRFALPSLEDNEILRRVSGGLTGALGDRGHLADISNPREAKIASVLLDHIVREGAEVSRHHRLQIAETLLQHGADPNRKHSSPGSGRTPLMLAAENDAADVFQAMVDVGGDPLIKDDQGNDCRIIARSFGSEAVLELLRDSRAIFYRRAKRE